MSMMANGTGHEIEHENLPIVDLSPFNSASSSEDRLAKAKELVKACRDVGFVYVKGHGIPKSEVQEAFAMSKKFFELPTEEKMKAPHPEGYSIYRGYSWPGLEKVSNALGETSDKDTVEKLREIQDYKESYDMGSDQNAEEPNVWLPVDVFPDLRNFMTAFYWDCWKVSRTILSVLALGLDIHEEALLGPHSGHRNQLRLLHYPPIPAKYIDEGKFARMPAHTDWSTLTILFQDDCGGLQVESPANPGTFIDVEPLEDALVLNIGDLLMRWSNDYLKSTQHRVQLPPLADRFTGEERMTRARYSIPYFVTCEPDMVIQCLRVGSQPTKYDPITQREYSNMRARMQY